MAPQSESYSVGDRPSSFAIPRLGFRVPVRIRRNATLLSNILCIGLHSGNHPGCSRHEAPESRGCRSQAPKSESVGSNSSSAPGTPQATAGAGARGTRPARLSSSAAAHRGVSSLGGGCVLAGRLNRGDVHLCRFASPDKQRPVLILTRDSAIGHLSAVTVAPITTTVRGVPSEMILDVDDGMKHRCAVNLHNVVTISQERLGKRLAGLSEQRMQEVCVALRFSLGCI